MEEKYDLVVIGAGPGGYTAAIKAAKSGLKTALIENREVGGTCLNRGCIPTKTLMHSSHLYYEALSFDKFGIGISGLSYDITKMQDRKDEVVNKIRDGISVLLKANKITVIYGTASILNQNSIRITMKTGELSGDQKEEKEIHTDKILIAAGSKPFIPGIKGIHSKNAVTSDELLAMKDKIYKKLLIIGGGIIGIEFATIYQELGCEVEIIEVMDRILPTLDKEISQSVAMNLKKRGIKIHTRSKVVKITEMNGLNCLYEEGAGKQLNSTDPEKAKVNAMKTVTADGILVSAGRKANTENLFESGFSVDMDGDKIKVDTNFETGVKGIYAIGDVIKGTQLAHAAAAQGIVAVENMCNLTPTINLNVIPSCIYTSPEVAVVGLSEEEGISRGYTVKTGKYPMSGNAKTVLSMDERSYVKVISDSATNKLLGAQIICARATDMIGEFAAAIVNGLSVSDMAAVIRPHPTYNEAITEAMEDIEGMAIHLMPNKR
ncbi:MAG: dihydrolipoyl dehydrogenase [Anaerocolumna sp.]